MMTTLQLLPVEPQQCLLNRCTVLLARNYHLAITRLLSLNILRHLFFMTEEISRIRSEPLELFWCQTMQNCR